MYKLNDQSDVELHEDSASALKSAKAKKAAEAKKSAEAKEHSLSHEALESAKKSQLDKPASQQNLREDKKSGEVKPGHFEGSSKGQK